MTTRATGAALAAQKGEAVMGDEQMLMEDEWEQYAKKRDAEVDALRAERDAALAEVARLRQANEYLEGANVALRGEHQQLCADWVKVLGNPANPEELDKAIAETPGMHALVRAIPWEAIEIAQQMYTLALEDMSGKVTLEDAAGYLVIVAAAKALDAFVGAHAPQPQEPQP